MQITVEELVSLPPKIRDVLNVGIWINREDVCIGCHNEDCGGCEYVKNFKD